MKSSTRPFNPAHILHGTNLSQWDDEIKRQLACVYPSIADLVFDGVATNPKLNGFIKIMRKEKSDSSDVSQISSIPTESSVATRESLIANVQSIFEKSTEICDFNRNSLIGKKYETTAQWTEDIWEEFDKFVQLMRAAFVQLEDSLHDTSKSTTNLVIMLSSF